MGLKLPILAIMPLSSEPVIIPTTSPGTDESANQRQVEYMMEGFTEDYSRYRAEYAEFNRSEQQAAKDLLEQLNKTKRTPPRHVFQGLVPDLLNKISSDSDVEINSRTTVEPNVGSLVKVANPGGGGQFLSNWSSSEYQ